MAVKGCPRQDPRSIGAERSNKAKPKGEGRRFTFRRVELEGPSAKSCSGQLQDEVFAAECVYNTYAMAAGELQHIQRGGERPFPSIHATLIDHRW